MIELHRNLNDMITEYAVSPAGLRGFHPPLPEGFDQFTENEKEIFISNSKKEAKEKRDAFINSVKSNKHVMDSRHLHQTLSGGVEGKRKRKKLLEEDVLDKKLLDPAVAIPKWQNSDLYEKFEKELFDLAFRKKEPTKVRVKTMYMKFRFSCQRGSWGGNQFQGIYLLFLIVTNVNRIKLSSV